MPKIRLYDLSYGFVRNYWAFGIRYEVSATKFTHMILGYIANLGHMLAFCVNYEAGRTNLTWHSSFEDLAKNSSKGDVCSSLRNIARWVEDSSRKGID